MSYAHCRQSFFEKFRILKMNITGANEEVNEGTLRKVGRNMVKRVDKCIEMDIISNTYFKYRLVL
jgi:hypothetical protein